MKKETQIDLNEMQPTNFPTFRVIGAPLGRGARKIGRGFKKLRRPALILLLILAVAHAGLNIYASVLLNRELAAIREKGEPLKFIELAPPPVSEAENAAPLYRKAYAARQLAGTEEREIFDALNPKAQKAPSKMRIRELLKRNQKALSLAREAAARPFCRFDSTWTGNEIPAAILFPQYAEMRSLARLLCVQALQEARDGNSAAALDNLRAVYRMGDHVNSDAILISFLVARAIDMIGDNILAQVLELQPQQTAQAQAFEASLPHTDWSAVFRRAYLAERSVGISGFEVFGAVPLSAFDWDHLPELPQWTAKSVAILWSPFSKLDEVYFLRLWTKRLNELQPISMPLKPHPSAADPLDQSPFYANITRMLTPVFIRTVEIRDAAEVARCQRQNVLAISAYRAAHNGAYPVTLQQAATAWKAPLLPDPYNGKPFGYRSDGQTFILYSVGPNGADDGGLNQARERNTYRQKPVPTMSDDIVWNYQKPRGS